MHDRLKFTNKDLMVPPQAEEILKDGDGLDFHNQYKSPGLSTPEEGATRRREADQRMLHQEIPKSPVEIGREQIVLVGSNLEAMRVDKIQGVLKQEEALYGGSLTEGDITKDAYELIG